MISRSGAITVAEMTSSAEVAIFIPSPAATGNHQYYNAKAVSERGGAIVIEEKDLNDEKLISTILKLKNDRAILEDMSHKSRWLPKNAAAEYY